jgi:hypothetical protein
VCGDDEHTELEQAVPFAIVRHLGLLMETSFRFQCFHRLRDMLGKIDAVAECNELAAREFVWQATRSGDHRAFIGALSKKHGIRVNDLDPTLFHVLLAQLYTVAVHQQAEIFYDAFRREHPASSAWTLRDDDDGLERILKNAWPSYDKARADIGDLETELADHYRVVRNRFAHVDVKETKIETAAMNLRQRVAKNSDYSRLQAPNPYNKLGFDDFVLFTRVTKAIANRLCVCARPSDEQIATMVLERAAKPHSGVDFKGSRPFRNNSARLRNWLAALLHTVYSLEKTEAQPIIDILLSTGPLAQR